MYKRSSESWKFPPSETAMFGARHGISPPSSSSPRRRIFPTQGSRPCCGKLMDFPRKMIWKWLIFHILVSLP